MFKLVVATLLVAFGVIAGLLRAFRVNVLARFHLEKTAAIATIVSIPLGLLVWFVPTPSLITSNTEPRLPESTVVEDVRLRSDFSHIAALRLLFGRDVMLLSKDDAVTATWFPTKVQANELFGFESGRIDTRVLMAMAFVEGGFQKYVFVVESVPGDSDYTCHACAPSIGVALFARRSQVWYLESFARHVANVGKWGKTPYAQLVQIGPDTHGVLFQLQDIGQGYLDRWFVLVALDPKAIRKVLVDSLGGNSDGAWEHSDPKHYSSQAIVGFVDSGKSDYFDVVVREYGTQPKENDYPKIEEISEQRIFTYDEGKLEFVLARKLPLDAGQLDPNWAPF